jgi:hypothetical protein
MALHRIDAGRERVNGTGAMKDQVIEALSRLPRDAEVVILDCDGGVHKCLLGKR